MSVDISRYIMPREKYRILRIYLYVYFDDKSHDEDDENKDVE